MLTCSNAGQQQPRVAILSERLVPVLVDLTALSIDPRSKPIRIAGPRSPHRLNLTRAATGLPAIAASVTLRQQVNDHRSQAQPSVIVLDDLSTGL